MGNTSSSQELKFGSVHKSGKDCRPGYYVNSKGVYYGGSIITRNIVSFQKLKYGYAKNDQLVFYNGMVIPGANTQSFRILNRGDPDNPTNCAIGIDSTARYKHGVPF